MKRRDRKDLASLCICEWTRSFSFFADRPGERHRLRASQGVVDDVESCVARAAWVVGIESYSDAATLAHPQRCGAGGPEEKVIAVARCPASDRNAVNLHRCVATVRDGHALSGRSTPCHGSEVDPGRRDADRWLR